MLATDKLVFIHMPKTGGTFVRHMLFRLHGVSYPAPKLSWRRVKWALKQGNMAGRTRYGPIWFQTSQQHNVCSQIPPEHAGKLLFGCVRNPFDWQVSVYEFGWWRSRPPKGWRRVQDLAERFPSYPELTFTDFVRLGWRSLEVGGGRDDLGSCTASFLHYFFRDHVAARVALSSEYLASGRYKQDMSDVRLLRMEQLNSDLVDLLGEAGYRDDDLEFIRGHPKVCSRTTKPGRGQAPLPNLLITSGLAALQN